MAKKNYYAVIRGRKAGIFTDSAQAIAHVSGFSGAICEGFKFRRDAVSFLRASGKNLPLFGKNTEVLEASLPFEDKPTNLVSSAGESSEEGICTPANSHQSEHYSQEAVQPDGNVVVNQSTGFGVDSSATTVNIHLPENGARDDSLEAVITISSPKPLEHTVIEVGGSYLTTIRYKIEANKLKGGSSGSLE